MVKRPEEMIQEFLVLLACTQNLGCSQTTNTYFQAHPEFKQMARNADKEAKKLIAPEVVLLSPLAIYAVRGKGSFRVNKYFSLELKQDSKMIQFNVSF